MSPFILILLFTYNVLVIFIAKRGRTGKCMVLSNILWMVVCPLDDFIFLTHHDFEYVVNVKLIFLVFSEHLMTI
jgi:hypothetical protein